MEQMAPIGNVTASVLLVTGYPSALAYSAEARARREARLVVTLEAATATITAGWLMHGRPLPAALKGAALAGFAIAWLVTGQRVGPLARKAS